MSSQKSVYAARELMLAGDRIPDHLLRAVRPFVLQSWQRSLRSGAQPDNPTLVFAEDHNNRTSLREAADPVLSRLADQLSGLQAGLLLSDREANIVRRWAPNTTIRPMMDRINSDVGFTGSEETIGTNGIGSVIELGTPIQVCGPEHLASALSAFTCVGVPVHHPVTRRLEGVITMNCLASAGNPLLTPLMMSTAQEVETRLLAKATTTERALLDRYVVAVGSRRAPVAAVGHDIFIAGPKVTELVEGINRALLWEHVQAVVTGARVEFQEPLGSGRFHITSCQPVELDGRIVGAIVEFGSARSEARRDPARPAAAHVAVTVPGRSAALAQAVAHATNLAVKGVPLLIEGEPGVGKLTLALELLGAAHLDRADITVVDAALGAAGLLGDFVATFRHELELEPPALVLKHVECLSSEAAAACASLIESAAAQGRLPRMITTAITLDLKASAGLRRLIDTVGVGRVSLTPLRERREDISPAAIEMLRKHSKNSVTRFSSAALRCLIRAPWPGNMRQLDATVRSVVSTVTGTEIRPAALSAELQGNSRRRTLSAMEELELSAILESLQRHAGNKAAAAQSIGISRSTLYRKLQAYHIDPDNVYF